MHCVKAYYFLNTSVHHTSYPLLTQMLYKLINKKPILSIVVVLMQVPQANLISM
jgi:hypothetical protein